MSEKAFRFGFKTTVPLAVIIIVIAWINRTFLLKVLTTFTLLFHLPSEYPFKVRMRKYQLPYVADEKMRQRDVGMSTNFQKQYFWFQEVFPILTWQVYFHYVFCMSRETSHKGHLYELCLSFFHFLNRIRNLSLQWPLIFPLNAALPFRWRSLFQCSVL